MIGATSTYDAAASPPEVEVADATAADLRFDTGAIGEFTTTRRIVAPIIELAFASDGLMTTLALEQTDGRPATRAAGWSASRATTAVEQRATRDPYEVQAEAFLDAVVARDPSRVLSTYADALKDGPADPGHRGRDGPPGLGRAAGSSAGSGCAASGRVGLRGRRLGARLASAAPARAGPPRSGHS